MPERLISVAGTAGTGQSDLTAVKSRRVVYVGDPVIRAQALIALAVMGVFTSWVWLVRVVRTARALLRASRPR